MPQKDAAWWFARMHSGEASDQDRLDFEAWRQADPEHDRQYRNLAYLWQATLTVPEPRLRALAADEPMPALASRPIPSLLPQRRRLGMGVAFAGLALAAAGLAAGRVWLLDTPLQTLQLATAKGERRQVTLPDGSTLELNTGTRAVVRLYEHKRLVDLQAGEMFFSVAFDVRRPFVVDAGLSEVTVTGTRFNVRREARQVQVSVQSGSVRVESGAWWHTSLRNLSAGQQVVAHQGQALSEVDAVDVDRVVAWQRGKILFNNMPLAQALDEMNRYLPQPVRLQAPGLRNHRISGVFSIDDPQSMLQALPSIAPVRIVRLDDGQSRVLAR